MEIRMKIAVIGMYYASNLGDAVICDCVAKWFLDSNPKAQVDIIDINGNKEFEIQPVVSLRILRKRQKNLNRDYWLTKHGFDDKVFYWSCKNMENRMDFYREVADRKYDAAIFAGGQIFMDWLSLDVCEFLKHFERVKTPVFFNACGAGISVSEKIRQSVQSYLSSENIKWISTRDDVDKIKDRYLSKDKEVAVTYDPALWTRETYGIEKKHESMIGLGVMYCNHIRVQKLIRFWKGIIKELDKKHIPWKMFCNGSMDDYNMAVNILEKLNLDKEQYLCPCPNHPKMLVEQIASFKGIISFRLHSHIIAASYEIPAVAIVWDEKLRFFYRHLRQEERCMTVEHSAADVVERFEHALKEGNDEGVLIEQKEAAKSMLLNKVKEYVRDC